MVHYKLLTPGPLTTTETVKKVMMDDHCTWDDDYKQITQKIRKELLSLAKVSEEEYTAILMQGSGTFGVESALTSAVGKNGKLLIAANGAYGERMEDIAKHAELNYRIVHFPYDRTPDAAMIGEILASDTEITHVAMVHSETTSGILNDIASVAKVVKAAGKTFIVDAMSSFGGVEIPVAELGIDFIVSSANKCIQGVPGFSFVICRRKELKKCEGQAVSLSLDLYDQWKGMDKDGKWRLEELKAEGGVAARNRRYAENNRVLIEKLEALGFRTYIPKELQGPFITTFFYPENAKFTFGEMYAYIKERGYAIYPGKLTDAETFRLGNIGEIYLEDVEKIAGIFQDFMNRRV